MEGLSVPGNVVYQHSWDGGGTCPRPPWLRGLGSGSRYRRYLNERSLRFLFYFAQAAFWSGAAVAVIIGLLVEATIDGLIIGLYLA